jgi:hypothetical protein
LMWSMLKLYTVNQCGQESANEELHNSQSHQAVKYDDGSLATQNREWLCWQGLAAIYPTDQNCASQSNEAEK